MQAAPRGTTDLRDRLRSLFRAARLPTNPAVAVEILRLADDPRSSAAQFAELISADAALAARLLAMANAAALGNRAPVTTIHRAVTLLGLRRLRMAALGFRLVAHIDRLGPARFDLESFWQHSVLRACLAREVAARVVPRRTEEAFLVGLLQDCGIPLLVQVLGEPYADLYKTADLTPTAFHEAERERFEYDHTQAVAAMAAEWRLPEAIAVPMARHHSPVEVAAGAGPDVRLQAVSCFVGSLPLAGGRTLAEREPGLRDYAARALGLDDAALAECLSRAGEAYREAAPLLGDRVPEDLDVSALLAEANRHLSRAADEAEARLQATEAERDRIRRQQSQLRSALGQYRERAARDPLTGLLNRGAVMEATLACIRECRDRNLPLAAFFLDIDDFKAVNDEFGHPVGDEVLRMIAAALDEALVNGGFAGRYGGEEFVVVLPAVEEEEARRRAAQLIERIRNRRPRNDAHPSVTCSAGAVWCHPAPDLSPPALFAAADQLMYAAKVGGKDRCCFRSAVAPGAVVVLAADAAAGVSPDLSPPPEPAPAESVSVEEFRDLALELNRAEPRTVVSMRKRQRQALLAPCTVNCFREDGRVLVGLPGFLRNISTGGVGLLTTRPLLRGEPVEVVIDSGPSARRLYVGGIVAFSRHVRRGIHETGVQLVRQTRAPIFDRDARRPDEQLDWVRDALRSCDLPRRFRESA